MSFKMTVIVFIQLTFVSTTISSVIMYNNARFDPIDTRYILSQFSSINSSDACLCQCYSSSICFTATYFGTNQTCLLFIAQLNQGQLRVVPTIMNAQVYDFGNSSFHALHFSNNTNGTVYPVWNTTAGGNSSSSYSGYSTGSYWPTAPPADAFDNNVTTEYINHGSCNYTTSSLTCGTNTGLYLTLNSGPMTLAIFYFITNGGFPQRDPLTITIEGSNLTGSALTLGSSWTLIYNGTSGLTNDPGRSTMGIKQIVSNVSIPFASYRLLATSKRGIQNSVSYSEFVIIGY